MPTSWLFPFHGRGRQMKELELLCIDGESINQNQFPGGRCATAAAAPDRASAWRGKGLCPYPSSIPMWKKQDYLAFSEQINPICIPDGKLIILSCIFRPLNWRCWGAPLGRTSGAALAAGRSANQKQDTPIPVPCLLLNQRQRL